MKMAADRFLWALFAISLGVPGLGYGAEPNAWCVQTCAAPPPMNVPRPDEPAGASAKQQQLVGGRLVTVSVRTAAGKAYDAALAQCEEARRLGRDWDDAMTHGTLCATSCQRALEMTDLSQDKTVSATKLLARLSADQRQGLAFARSVAYAEERRVAEAKQATERQEKFVAATQAFHEARRADEVARETAQLKPWRLYAGLGGASRSVPSYDNLSDFDANDNIHSGPGAGDFLMGMAFERLVGGPLRIRIAYAYQSSIFAGGAKDTNVFSPNGVGSGNFTVTGRQVIVARRAHVLGVSAPVFLATWLYVAPGGGLNVSAVDVSDEASRKLDASLTENYHSAPTSKSALQWYVDTRLGVVSPFGYGFAVFAELGGRYTFDSAPAYGGFGVNGQAGLVIGWGS